MKSSAIGLVSVVSCLMTTTVHASLIAQWNNDDLAASATSASADFVEDGLSVSTLALGAGLNGAVAWPNAIGAFANALPTSLSSSLSGNRYFSFTVTPDVETQISFDDVFIRLAINTGNIAVDNVISFNLFSDATGLNDGDQLGSYLLTRAAGSSAVISGTTTFDLSSVLDLQNVDSAVQFRVYAFQQSGTGNRMAIGVPFATDGLADLSVNGTISVGPEPTSVSLFGLACVIAMGFRKTRSRR